jgi:hypothetical protein
LLECTVGGVNSVQTVMNRYCRTVPSSGTPEPKGPVQISDTEFINLGYPYLLSLLRGFSGKVLYEYLVSILATFPAHCNLRYFLVLPILRDVVNYIFYLFIYLASFISSFCPYYVT